ncbi:MULTISPECIES: hypothetical protein [Aeromonas]|uniref:hypothetical protein n=1 Tax=Aeromonas TaxID=642 RepID=UPI0019201668|nr:MULTISPECIES: hypothetical protein [Aeromonas]MBL0460841.1 hypothetical protein [Aeromonas dhakensis]QXC06325.1 hypothetical protein I6L38_11215 [Aeromonas sp. FDAARGOS 1408]
MAKRIIKLPKEKTDGKISAQDPSVNYDEHPPIFSLERLQSGNFCLQTLDQEGKANFAEAIFRRKGMMWKDIKQMPKHGLGFEKISKTAIHAAIPNFITPDVDHFLAFRYHGKRAMVGYRKNDIFYVLWFDSVFTLYSH